MNNDDELANDVEMCGFRGQRSPVVATGTIWVKRVARSASGLRYQPYIIACFAGTFTIHDSPINLT